MQPFTVLLATLSFVFTVILILWRPRGLNEAIPAMCGALVTVISGAVSWADLQTIGNDVGGAAITILSTIAMAIALESFGVFQFIANFLVRLSKNSGIRLFWFINLMSLLMTMFFNNDGGIILGTPILLLVLRKIGLKPHQQIPYLLSGALIDTAASAPIGVSNIVNLISLKIVGMNLLTFTSMMFVPAMLGLCILAFLNYLLLRKDLTLNLLENAIPKHRVGPPRPPHYPHHRHGLREHHAPVKAAELSHDSMLDKKESGAQKRFMRNILLYVLGVRVGLFVGVSVGIPVSLTALAGALVLLIWRWVKLRISPYDVLKKTPWHILLFAFGMYVVVYGLHKIGFTDWLVHLITPFIAGNWLHAVLVMGIVVTVMSNLFNNHPALMVGTLTLTRMHLDPTTLKIAYLGNVVGSDIGSLIMPIGLLATLIWMHILRQNRVKITWGRYIRLTVIVIPLTVLATTFLIYGWVCLIS